MSRTCVQQSKKAIWAEDAEQLLSSSDRDLAWLSLLHGYLGCLHPGHHLTQHRWNSTFADCFKFACSRAPHAGVCMHQWSGVYQLSTSVCGCTVDCCQIASLLIVTANVSGGNRFSAKSLSIVRQEFCVSSDAVFSVCMSLSGRLIRFNW